jgi:hypothetical protein
MVFQGAKKPIRQPCKSAIRNAIFTPRGSDFQLPGRKWQTGSDLLERCRQQFGIFAGGAIPGIREVCALRLT